MEYLSARAPWDAPFHDGVRNMTEVPHPDLPSGKRLDLGLKARRGDHWALLMEAKWLSRPNTNPKAFIFEILEDLIRLRTVEQDTTHNTWRLLLLAGHEKDFRKVLNHEGILGKVLARPAKILYSRKRSVADLDTVPALAEFVARARANIGETIPTGLATRLEGRSRSKIGETRDDQPVWVGLWRVTLPHKAQ